MRAVRIAIANPITVDGTDLQVGIHPGFELIEDYGPLWHRKRRFRYLIDTRAEQEAEFGFSLGTGPDVTLLVNSGAALVQLVPPND